MKVIDRHVNPFFILLLRIFLFRFIELWPGLPIKARVTHALSRALG